MDLDELRPCNSLGRDSVWTHVHHTRLSGISGLGGRGFWPPVHTLPGLLKEKTRGSLSEGFLETCGVQAGSVGLAKPPGVTQNRPQMRIVHQSPCFLTPWWDIQVLEGLPEAALSLSPRCPPLCSFPNPIYHLPSLSCISSPTPLFRFLGNHLPKKASCLRVCFRGGMSSKTALASTFFPQVL